MTPRQLFQLDENKIKFLHEVLIHPVMAEAISIVKQETVPKEPMLVPGIDLNQQMSLEGAKAVGANSFFQLLTSLSIKALPREKGPDESQHEIAVQQMLKSGLYKDRAEVESLLKQQ